MSMGTLHVKLNRWNYLIPSYTTIFIVEAVCGAVEQFVRGTLWGERYPSLYKENGYE